MMETDSLGNYKGNALIFSYIGITNPFKARCLDVGPLSGGIKEPIISIAYEYASIDPPLRLPNFKETATYNSLRD